jgi:hypothetical protein
MTWNRQPAMVTAIALLVTFLPVSGSASASIIDDKSDFVGDFTVIDFETWGDGTPIELEPLEAISISSFAYASLGMTITASDVLLIGRVTADQTTIGLAATGSPPNILGVFGRHGWVRLDFDVPVNAVGLSVLNWSNGDPVALWFYDSADMLLESVAFNGQVVDGTIQGTGFGNPFDIDYGFVGAFCPNGQIAYAVATDDLTVFDDLHFGVIPEPTTLVFLVFGSLAVVSTRRRSRASG